jgi:hypothetical protein
MEAKGGLLPSPCLNKRPLPPIDAWMRSGQLDPEPDIHVGLSISRNRPLVQALSGGSNWAAC